MSEEKGNEEKQQPSQEGKPEDKKSARDTEGTAERKGLPTAKSSKPSDDDAPAKIETLGSVRKPTGTTKTRGKFAPARPVAKEEEPKKNVAEWEEPADSAPNTAQEEEFAPRGPAPEEQAAAFAKTLARNAKKVLFFNLKLIYVVVAVVLLAVWLNSVSYEAGVTEGRRLANKEAEFDGVELDPGFASKLNASLFKLRNGNAEESLKELKDLQTQWPSVVSMNYLVALAALETGDEDLASTKATESIARRQRVSDSLALLAVIESQKAARRDKFVLGNPVKRAEEYLRRSIAADPANPYPHFELASILRYSGKRQEALEEVRAAMARLSAVDSHLVMDVTAHIMERETMADAQLPPDVGTTDNVQKLVPAAYVAMRRGNFDRAAELLNQARQGMTPDVFTYVVNDPAIRRYRNEPKLQPFFAQ